MLFMHTAVAEAAGSAILPEMVQAAPRAGQDVAGQYAVAVRSLCEFTARQGDLDLRFTPAPSAQEGIAGHQLVASRRPAHYQTEVSLTGSYGPLRVRGRADGYDPVLQQLEEIKTHRGELSAMPANHRHLHWAQARMYGWLMCSRQSLDGLNVALVYFDVVRRSETVLVERFSAQELERFFNEQCHRFLDWARCEIAHRDRRDAALRELRFVHPEFRKGQRLLAESVYRAAIRGRCLMAQAPTGIGKTIGTLFPMLKAAPVARIDKIFFLCAKTSGRQLGLEALRRICGSSGQDQPLRVLELAAREKSCEHPDKACHGDSCPLAKGFYDRLPAARERALLARRTACNGAAADGGAGGLEGDGGQGGEGEQMILDRPALREIALAHGICPYYLGQDLARWCDVVVGDYNYYFDSNAFLHGMTLANQWRVALLADEAHNLLERARGMYTASLDQRRLRALRRTVPAVLRRPLSALERAWNGLHREQDTQYQPCESLPRQFVTVLQQTSAAITEMLSEGPPKPDPDLLRFYFDLLHFLRLAEAFGEHSIFDITRFDASGRSAGGSTLCLRNVVPAPFLKPRLATAAASVLFSATLVPREFHSDMLGLPKDAAWLEVPSPFDPSQLTVRVASRVSTRFRERDASVAPIVQLIAGQYQREPGNYLAFFSSFDYLQAVADQVAARHPAISLRRQTRGMTEAEQADFLARFEPAGREVAFAVLGGAFGEAIDLPGDRLLGAFVATLGLPQVNPVNEEMRRRMQACFGRGYDYAYLYPGLQKVVQAAGRVIRTPQDRGVLYLIDDRFARAEVRRLLPVWWALG
jgi:DNA excision repair protein ERCC-2